MTEKGARRSQLDLLCADSSSEHRFGNLNAFLACSGNIKAKHLVHVEHSLVASEQDWEKFSELLDARNLDLLNFKYRKMSIFSVRQKDDTNCLKVQILPRWITQWVQLGKENFPTDPLIIKRDKNLHVRRGNRIMAPN